MLRIENITNELVSVYAFFASILTFEIIVMSFLTGQRRLKTLSFANPEDAIRRGDTKYCRLNPEVERLRRIVRNDVENIPTFLVTSFLYILTGPRASYFAVLMGLYTLLRILYSFAYACAFQSPTRSVLYSFGLYFVKLPMLVTVFYNCLLG
ncbi:prostaglandin E synthase-like [Clavelina lepadiformis]|uniref:Prostaglandin E synthase n=1 Tax=Clavelina lepadiformis TaxID=159417 RepID=A0ABP0F3X1_CLALP